jgi:hypothetical protein
MYINIYNKDCVETITITTNFTILLTLYAIHLKVRSLFCIFIPMDVICSPNNLFMTDTIVSSLLRWLYRILLYQHFIPFCICHESSIVFSNYFLLLTITFIGYFGLVNPPNLFGSKLIPSSSFGRIFHL